MDLRFLYFFFLLGLVQSVLINLKCDGIKKFVNGHNTRRLRLAKGQVPGEPAASKMNKMVTNIWPEITLHTNIIKVWDEELTTKSRNWADREQYGHNPDKTIPSERFIVGENIYKYSTTNTSYRFDPDRKTLTSWFNEYKNFTYKQLERSDFAKNKPKIGHYTQMAWANSVYLGCAISRFNENKNGNNFISYYVVCNYGPAGNVIGQAPYEKGQASRTLKCSAGSDCAQPYGRSCRAS